MNSQRVPVALAATVVVVGLVGVFGAANGLVPAGSDQPSDSPASEPTADATAPTVYYEGDALTLENDPGEMVNGTTNLTEGTEITVRLKSTSGRNPFIRQATTAVGEDGGFEATFDMSATEAGTSFSIAVRHDGANVTTAPGEIVEGTVPEQTQTSGGEAGFDDGNETLTLQSAPGQVVSGTTDQEPGTRVVVRLRSEGSSQPFIRQATSTVGDDGAFQTTFNMSDVEPGATFSASVLTENQTLYEKSGEVVTSD